MSSHRVTPHPRQHPPLGQQGSAVLELALTAPLLLLLLAGAVDFANAWRINSTLAAAAEAAALFGLTHPADTNGMQTAARLSVALPSLQATATRGCECSDSTAASLNCTSAPTCSSGTLVNFVDVATSAVYTPSFPLPGLPGTCTLHGHARLRSAYR